MRSLIDIILTLVFLEEGASEPEVDNPPVRKVIPSPPTSSTVCADISIVLLLLSVTIELFFFLIFKIFLR